MSRRFSTYEELVAKNKAELLSDEQKLDEFEEQFEERLANNSKQKEKRLA